MANVEAATEAPVDRRRLGRLPPFLLVLAIAILVVVVVCAVVGSWLTPHDPGAQDPLLGAQGPSGAHWLGTDELGRDILSRLIAGTRNAVLGPLVVATLTVLIGLALGMTAGFRGGFADSAIARTTDVLYCLPALMIAIVVVAVIGGGYLVTIGVLVFLSFPGDVRIFRSVTMVQARLPYVDAARTLGLTSTKTMVRHILPNIRPTVIATFLLEFAGALIAFSALAFLGLGVNPGGTDWGTLVADGQSQLFVNPVMAMAPALLLILVAASVTVVGDWLYDRTSPAGTR